ncbi:Rad52/Rad22 family DNA repair protein [Vibrio casei]|uniref:Recombinase n=1 Tax=Vibrio casei TaxID=673372 RepID=A0A368LHB9_9VIBR|nr:Rad52/Rad22 family DNA repair protein [Vibrio casei]RCS70142.1 hypothetical protein CIK83_11795 [Vibrio casei]SJN24251.1 Phage essential recombination function protein, Erf [Vibrio casei]
MSSKDSIEMRLQRPFDDEDIQWRVQQAGVSKANKPYVMAIPYVNNRAIQKRLDEVFGLFGWENAYKPTPDGKGYICGITVHQDGKSVTKWDGAEYTNIEPLKGALSDSMKRSAVQLGIGRYLYQLDVCFAECHIVENRRDAINVHVHYPNKQNKSIKTLISWSNPTLPVWALPFDDYSEFIEKIKGSEDMEALKAAFLDAYKAGQSSQDEELVDQAVKAKDKRKAEIEKTINQINAKKYAEVDGWLTKELSMFNQLPTKATVDNYLNGLNERLLSRVKGQPFDSVTLVEKMNQAHQSRLTNLKNKG